MILSNLTQPELLKMSATAKAFRNLCFDPTFWTDLVLDVEKIVNDPDIHISLMERATKVKRLEFYHEDEELADSFIIDARKLDRKSTRLNSSHSQQSRMPSSA